MKRVESATLAFDASIQEQSGAAEDVQTSIGNLQLFDELVRDAAQGQRRESRTLDRLSGDVSVSSARIAEATGEQDEPGLRAGKALERLASAVVRNRSRAERIGRSVAVLSRRSAELDRKVARFQARRNPAG